MAVYVDDAMIPAKVRQWDTRWCHLIADSRDELHAFAARLGLRRDYFQEPKGLGGPPPKPGSYSAESWHYDVTARKRGQAITLGAIPISYRDLPGVIRARMVRQGAGGFDPDRWVEGQKIVDGTPREGQPCVCDAREGLHLHAGDEVFGLVLDSRVPRGTMVIGPSEHLAQLSFDSDLASAWGLGEQEGTT